jgi:PAS domain S-box-containing protein
MDGHEKRQAMVGGAPLPGHRHPLSESDVVSMLAAISDGVAVMGPDWRFRYVNRAAGEMLRTPPHELIGRTVFSHFGDAGSAQLRQALEDCVRDGLPFRINEYYPPLERWFEGRGFRQDENVVVLFRDITEPHLADERLREYTDRMAEAERIAHFGVWRWDLQAGQLHMSAELQQIHGLEPRDLPWPPQQAVSQLHPEDRAKVESALEEARRTLQPFEFGYRIVRPDGTERSLFCHGRVIVDRDGVAAGLVAVCHDMTDRELAERELGLSERRMRSILDHSPSVISVTDLDGRYLMANDECGRLAGMDPEDVVGRTTAELFPEVDAQQHSNERQAIARRRPVYDEVVLIHSGQPRTYATVTFPLPGASGRPAETCTIGTDVTEQRIAESAVRERNALEHMIDSALREDRMLVHAQPVMSLADDAVAGYELLVRMRSAEDPDWLVEPREFLPAAERLGLIQRIDIWMVRQALALAEHFAPTVNLSAVTLSDPAAREEIVALLRAALRVAPSAVQEMMFEITETASAQYLDAAGAFAAELTRLGCGLALDDFGTGFGSFTYLRQLPLRYLKIDRSFVTDLPRSEDDRRVVQSVIGIAGQFGLKTIAEGVEDMPTHELLRSFGTHYAQGNHLGRPAPVQTFL